jgi:hypothetical protein
MRQGSKHSGGPNKVAVILISFDLVLVKAVDEGAEFCRRLVLNQILICRE